MAVVVAAVMVDTPGKDWNMGQKQFMVRYLDPDGLCRAWAIGPLCGSGNVTAQGRRDIRKLAESHLAQYRIEKAAHRDPLAYAAFTKDEYTATCRCDLCQPTE